VNAADRKRLHLARQIVWSLDAGITITLLLAVLRAAHVFPVVTDVLLRPIWYLLPRMFRGEVLNGAIFVVTDAVLYAIPPFIAMHLWSSRRAVWRPGAIVGERRSGFRVALATPVFVYGWLAGEPFLENTETLNVSESGGLISLSADVRPSQELVLTNLQTDADQLCRVARSTTRADGKTLAGLTFLRASPDFWQIQFVSKQSPPQPIRQNQRMTG
jgi:hypothetical protein